MKILIIENGMINKKITEVTIAMSKDIWGLAVIVIVMILGIGVISGILAPNNIIGVLVTSLFQWIVVMVSASLMTTLYGHIIERRPIL